MATPLKVRVSEEEYLATMTGEKPSLEFVNGEVFQKPLTKKPHNDIARLFGRLFFPYEALTGGYWSWEATTNVSRGADRRYRVPDLAFWMPGKPVGSSVFEPPTLAIEIRSERQSMRELREKCREYRSRGVDVCWLVDPETRTVEVFEGERDGEPLPAGGTLASPHLPGFSLPLADLWAVLE